MAWIVRLVGMYHLLVFRNRSFSVTNCITDIVDQLSLKCIPYLVLMVVPVLGRMTDQDLSIQMMASQCFASLIKLMPLEVCQIMQ